MSGNLLTTVGIGASAGGLDAFEKLLKNAPSHTNMALVLIQHLDPEHQSQLAEILQRSTSMPVIEVTDNLALLPGHVYVIPPNRYMTVTDGTLHLTVQESPRGKRLPIDTFLISLSQDQTIHPVGIILSGTGSDGTLGLEAIKNCGGITLVQDPATAQYDGMPNNAIASGHVTKILKPEKMLTELASGIVPQAIQESDTDVEININLQDLLQILMLLRSATGHDFTEYKKSTIRRRIERRMFQHSLTDPKKYAQYLRNKPSEIQFLMNELLINVTSFFRDTEAFEYLEKKIIPKLFIDKKDSRIIRVWVAGCATGEEAYSIAILLREYMDRVQQEYKIQLYATDLDQDAITTARTGFYPISIKKNISSDRIRKFFHEEKNGMRVNKQIRDMVIFAVQNVIKDPPLIKLDLLCCRNLMIYLEPELQNRLISKFNFSLLPGAVLFLSPAESIGNHTSLFSVLNRSFKLYQAIKTPVLSDKLPISEKQWIPVMTRNVINPVDKIEIQTPIVSDIDLKSNNEELQSINEELQSANEELETSKEELQSVNEELVTVNAELQVKIDQLAGIQNDMKNLLDNMNVGTIFLDQNLIIRRFTREAVRAYRLIDSDIGRPLEDITSNLIQVDLLECARQVITSNVPFERELSTATGIWYLVHIQSYLTLDNVIKGVVMTFTDITKRVQAENATLFSKTLAEGIVDTVLEPLVVLNAELKVQSASRSFFSFFRVTPENTIGRLIYDLGNRQWDIPALRELLETILPQHQSFEGYIVEHEFQEIGIKKMSLNARRIIDKNGNTQLILFAMQAV
jgi:chemotaxis methyl-accepting protein methylase